MTIQSATVTVNNNTFETVDSVASVSLTAGTTYTMQIQNIAEVKIADAIFTVENEKFLYKAGTEDLYIKTPGLPCVLTILENEEAE